ncbi:MAG: ATP-binding cassette domain-containing protein [Thermoplasmata archaeon]|nr:ATP-binding cassette domain-containing protein [Thermoplasmata archaeon]
MDDITKVYEVGETEIRALNGVDLEIMRGRFVSIMGPSGSGKSTLLNVIGCIDTPTSGSLRIMDQEVSRLKDKDLTAIRLSTIGFIFQQFYLIPTLNAIENVELPMKEARIPRDDRHRRATQLLAMVGLSNRMSHLPNQLSGGEQQRVAIARALANEPDILLADEPTGEVDSQTSDSILSILEDLNRDRGLTMVVVSHDPNVANRAPRRLSMVDGKIVSDRSGPMITGGNVPRGT